MLAAFVKSTATTVRTRNIAQADQREEETRMRLKGQGSNTMLWIAAIVVLIVVVGLAYYFLVLAPR